MQRGPNATVSFTPSHFAGGCGAFQRSGPTGGAAYGMPLNTRTAASVPAAPDTWPASVFTGSVIAAEAAVAASRNAAVIIERFMKPLAGGLLKAAYISPGLKGPAYFPPYFAAARSSAREALSM